MDQDGNKEAPRLLDIFDEGYKLYEALSKREEPTNSQCVQYQVRQSMKLLEDATRLTSLAGVFSSNEMIDEVPTENLRLFLLPALLGMLTLKISGPVSRTDVVRAADTYFRDFLERCEEYEIIRSIRLPPPLELECKEGDMVAVNGPCRPFDLANAGRDRAMKIARYKEEKALEEEVARLYELVKDENVDEEVKRDFYIKLIKTYTNKATEELDALQSEARILVHLKAAKKNENAEIDEIRSKQKPVVPRPLNAVIITKDAVQKAVFGAGYPSLPAMTVEEFYEKRVKDGIFPDPGKAGKSLQDMAKQGTSNAELDEQEAAERDARQEADDEEQLRRQRAMDEFKDDHRRGEGNRYNRS
ncbi:Immunoglobulin-Hypothetical protein protein [Nesidiocoris tenuis]|uniref:Immunoglobulin-binding protein 1 n=1 Tax=Nesidiocoris tenuis TaxID=355587 RepID=A0ABN7AIQ0_9HEMI|nr:Immunoglobulin-Hypothetical protein protein [Nesidiocoris tenuis]